MMTLARCLEVELARYGASRCHVAGGSQRTARLQRAQVADELPCAVFPGALKRKTPAGLARDAEGADASTSQVAVQSADRVVRNHIKRAGDREGGDGRAACQRFELHDAKGIGAAWENKDVCRGQMGRQILARLFAQETGVRIPALQLGPLRSLPDHNLGPGQVQ